MITIYVGDSVVDQPTLFTISLPTFAPTDVDILQTYRGGVEVTPITFDLTAARGAGVLPNFQLLKPMRVTIDVSGLEGPFELMYWMGTEWVNAQKYCTGSTYERTNGMI